MRRKVTLVSLTTAALVLLVFWLLGYWWNPKLYWRTSGGNTSCSIGSGGGLIYIAFQHGAMSLIGFDEPPSLWASEYHHSENGLSFLLEVRGLVPFILLAVYPVITLFSWLLRLLGQKKGHCQKCGYNLTGNTSGICPECGEKI